jgi:hypothetical protein
MSGTVNVRHRLEVEAPTIKILLYADDPDAVTESSSEIKFISLGLMLERLRAHEPASASLNPKYVCRYRRGGTEPANRIDDVLASEFAATGQPFDEIWFFGVHQANISKSTLGLFEGGQHNELDANEVSAILNWMQENKLKEFPGGGVLMTGDHSNQRPDNVVEPSCPEPNVDKTLLGLGRALGRCVPRAGLLRKWEGPPTRDQTDRNNTVERPGNEDDITPQRLTLRKVNEAGDPDPQGQPHPLFFYKPGQWIEVFPDHTHEGSLTMPGSFDPAIWPPGLNKTPQPRPQVVAYGINQRTSEPERLDIIAVYHGDRAGVGRIVADSTWHHYFNLNLQGFPHPAPEGSDSDRIGQFYANLAVWLSPRSKRSEMAYAMFWELAKYTLRMERSPDAPEPEWSIGRMERSSKDPEPEWSIGRAAYNILTRVASACEVHALFQVVTPERFANLSFPEESSGLSHLPPRELLLGSVMCAYHDEMRSAARGDDSYQPLGVDEVINSGFTRAFELLIKSLRQKADDALNLLTVATRERIVAMACPADTKNPFTIVMSTDPADGRVFVEKTLHFCLNLNLPAVGAPPEQKSAETPITGTVDDLSVPVTGTRISTGVRDVSFVILEFDWAPSHVFMSGIIFPDAGGRILFAGRFLTAAHLDGFTAEGGADAVVFQGPDPGDTGTGTGSQT